MNKAVPYARVSTDKQREKHTIGSQLSILPELIKQKGYAQVGEPYIDDGLSGETIDDRPAMLRLLEDAERGLFDAVFVVDIDRLTRARKSFDWEVIKETFRKNRVLVITPSQEYNFEDEDQEFMSDLFSRISSYEKKKILRRMLRGKREKARQGKFFGGKALYGYTWDETTKQYEVVEDEAKVIRLIFNFCLQGLSIRRIPDYLTKLGYPTPVDSKGYRHRRKSNKWATSTIRRILTNSTYAGEFVRWKYKRFDKHTLGLRPKDEWVLSQAPMIISPDVFEQAHEALTSRKALSSRNSKREYLLSGLIYCESCACKMTGECSMSHNGEARYYVCANGRRRHLDKECPKRSIKAEEIELSVWEEIKKLLKSPTLLKKAILQSRSVDTSQENLTELNKQLENKAHEEERLLDLYQLGKFNIDTLNSRIEAIRREKEAISRAIEALSGRTKLDQRLKTLNELRIELETNIDTFDFERKRKALKILLWGKDGIGVFLRPDYTAEIRGLVDFTKLNEIERIERQTGIENTSFS